MKKIILLILLSTLPIVLPMAVNCKPTIGPPSINLRTSLSNIAVVELLAIKPDNYLSFKKIKDIHNKADESITIKSSNLIAGSLKLNKQYIIAYSAFQSTRRPVKVFPRKGGAVLINITGAAPAIFSYSKDLETILKWNMDESLKSPKEMLPIILRNSEHIDPQIHSFFIAELMTRKNIYKHLTNADYLKIIQVLENPNTTDTAKHLILSYSNILEKHITPSRLCGILSDILNNSDINFDIYSLKPALIRQVLVAIRACDSQFKTNHLSRWLFSNNTGVIEETLDSLRIIDTDNYLHALNEILNTTLVNNKTRTTINTYIKRMMREKNE